MQASSIFNTMFTSRSHNRLRIFLCLIAGLGVGGKAANAQPAPTSSEKTEITSERMTVRNKEHRAVFEGDVVLTRGALEVKSDVMVVFYDTGEKDGATGQSGSKSVAVKRIEAMGNVKIKRAEGRATCEKAVFYQDGQKVVLTGNPVAWQRGNRVTGDKITLLLDEDRTIVEGGSRLLLDEVGAVQ